MHMASKSSAVGHSCLSARKDRATTLHQKSALFAWSIPRATHDACVQTYALFGVVRAGTEGVFCMPFLDPTHLHLGHSVQGIPLEE